MYGMSNLLTPFAIAKSFHLEPYFPPHTARDVYLTLLHTDSPKPPDSLLRSALLLRACENIRRILTIRTRKPALQTLLQRGSVGDDIWQRLVRAEKELEEEVRDVVNEANALANNWGQIIFQSANEMVNREILAERLAIIKSEEAQEKQKWETFKVERRQNALKELGEEVSSSDDEDEKSKGKDQAGSALKAGIDATVKKVEAIMKGTSVSGSDEDAVLVEKEAASTTTGTSSTPSKKKKKGKK